MSFWLSALFLVTKLKPAMQLVNYFRLLLNTSSLSQRKWIFVYWFPLFIQFFTICVNLFVQLQWKLLYWLIHIYVFLFEVKYENYIHIKRIFFMYMHFYMNFNIWWISICIHRPFDSLATAAISPVMGLGSTQLISPAPNSLFSLSTPPLFI